MSGTASPRRTRCPGTPGRAQGVTGADCCPASRSPAPRTSSASRKSRSSKAKRITASMHSRVCTCPGVPGRQQGWVSQGGALPSAGQPGASGPGTAWARAHVGAGGVGRGSGEHTVGAEGVGRGGGERTVGAGGVGRGGGERTGGVAGVDDTERTRAAVVTRLAQCTVKLGHVQRPGTLLVQVVIHLHCAQLCQRGRVEWVLGDRDEHTRARVALAGHQQLQHRLRKGRRRQGWRGLGPHLSPTLGAPSAVSGMSCCPC